VTKSSVKPKKTKKNKASWELLIKTLGKTKKKQKKQNVLGESECLSDSPKTFWFFLFFLVLPSVLISNSEYALVFLVFGGFTEDLVSVISAP